MTFLPQLLAGVEFNPRDMLNLVLFHRPGTLKIFTFLPHPIHSLSLPSCRIHVSKGKNRKCYYLNQSDSKDLLFPPHVPPSPCRMPLVLLLPVCIFCLLGFPKVNDSDLSPGVRQSGSKVQCFERLLSISVSSYIIGIKTMPLLFRSPLFVLNEGIIKGH